MRQEPALATDDLFDLAGVAASTEIDQIHYLRGRKLQRQVARVGA